MITLGIDTGTSIASVAVARDGKCLAQRTAHRSLSHSESIPEMVHQILRTAGQSAQRLDRIGIAVGPGSFTGLRIGISYTMGLAGPNRIPAKGYSSLALLARLAGDHKGLVRPVVNAYRGGLFTSLFRSGPEGFCRLEEDRLVDAKEIRNLGGDLLAVEEPAVLCGEGGPAVRVTTSEAAGPLLARLVWEDGEDAKPASELRPRYLRPSAAEEMAATKGN